MAALESTNATPWSLLGLLIIGACGAESPGGVGAQVTGSAGGPPVADMRTRGSGGAPETGVTGSPAGMTTSPSGSSSGGVTPGEGGAEPASTAGGGAAGVAGSTFGGGAAGRDSFAGGGATGGTSGGAGSTSTAGSPAGGTGGAEPARGGASQFVGEASCDGGPLDAPLAECEPEPPPSTGDFYQDCVDRINQLRWECQCLPPLDRWVEAESCADEQAEYDYEVGQAHAGIRAGICEPGGGGQNECPDYGPRFGIVEYCLQQMWDEGPGDDFNAHGHYLNMSDTSYTKVACGRFETPEGNVWSVQNFSR